MRASSEPPTCGPEPPCSGGWRSTRRGDSPRADRPSRDRRPNGRKRTPARGRDDPGGRPLLGARKAGHRRARQAALGDRAMKPRRPHGGPSPRPASRRSRRPSCAVLEVSGPICSRPSEPRAWSRARQLAIYLTRDLTSLSLAQIAREFNRDHSTVLHAIRAVERRLEPESEISEQLERTPRLVQAERTATTLCQADLHHPTATSTSTVHRRQRRSSSTISMPSPQSSTTPNTSEPDRKMQDPAMKLTISRDSLLTGLQLAAPSRFESRHPARARRDPASQRPADSLTLQATDTELGLKRHASRRQGRNRRERAPARPVDR